MNEFSCGDRQSHPHVGTLSLDDAEIVLKSADIRTYRVRADRHGEVIDITNRQTLGDRRVEARNICNMYICSGNSIQERSAGFPMFSLITLVTLISLIVLQPRSDIKAR